MSKPASQTDMNEFLAGKVGIKWHECDGILIGSNFRHCSCGVSETSADSDYTIYNHIYDNNSNYFTAEGRQVLLEWAVEQGWWFDFIHHNRYRLSIHGNTEDDLIYTLTCLFIPVSALAEAVYKYLKEREG